MKRRFVEVPLFTRRWEEVGLGSEDLRSLQMKILKAPEVGPVMEGTGGIRKVRFPLGNRGKSGSVRVCYVDFEEYEVTYLITAFIKNKQANLSASEKNILRQIVKALKGEASKKGDDTDERIIR